MLCGNRFNIFSTQIHYNDLQLFLKLQLKGTINASNSVKLWLTGLRYFAQWIYIRSFGKYLHSSGYDSDDIRHHILNAVKVSCNIRVARQSVCQQILGHEPRSVDKIYPNSD